MSTASLVLGLLALGVGIYLFLMMRKARDELVSAKADIQTIATHIEQEVHPAVEWLTEQYQFAATAPPLGFDGMMGLQQMSEEEVAQAMLGTLGFM